MMNAMKRCVIMLLVVLAAGVALLVGCQKSGEHYGGPGSQDTPMDFVYTGTRYICTGVNVARQDIDADTPSNVMYIGSTLYQIGEYDVYLIQGFDKDEAIALKIGVGGYYSYCKYEKVYGQQEPLDFVYEGSHYVETGEIIDIERVASATGTPERLTYLSSVIYQGTTYDVYSIHIQGEDRSQAIALRIAKAGKTVGFYYYYFTYERQ